MSDAVMVDQSEPTPISAAPSYFAPPPRWTPVSYQFWADEGDVHLIAEVDPAGLTNAAIAWLAAPDRLIGELVRILAPRVRAWNVGRFDLDTGAWGPAPGPDEIGERAFYDGVETTMIVLACRNALIEVTAAKSGLQKKERTPSESGRETRNAEPSDSGTSSATAKKSRSRKASTPA